VIQVFKNAFEMVFKDLKIDCHTTLVQFLTFKEGLDGEIVTMEFLALPVIVFKPVSSRKRVLYAEGKHYDNLYVALVNVNLLSAELGISCLE
jgi:hypothetical protein